MSDFWEEPKDTAATDRYSLTIDPLWLDGEAILTATWSTQTASGLTLSNEMIVGNIVSALFSAGNIGGYWCVEVVITTATRSKTFCGTMVIADCC